MIVRDVCAPRVARSKLLGWYFVLFAGHCAEKPYLNLQIKDILLQSAILYRFSVLFRSKCFYSFTGKLRSPSTKAASIRRAPSR